MITTGIVEQPSPKIGILGGGFMARVHTAAARTYGAQVLGVASSDRDSAIRAASALGIPIAFESAEELIRSSMVETVHVCTPNATHDRYAALALDAGKNVICEKPLATSANAASELTKRAASSGAMAAVPFVYRYHPMVREARARTLRGELGRLFTVRGQYLQDWLWSVENDDWRVDEKLGGPSRAFADIGSHLCDLIEFVTGDRIARVSARSSTVHPRRGASKVTTEDAVAVAFETDGGAIGTLLVSQVSAGRKNHLTFEISGQNQSLIFDQERPDLLWVGRPDGFRAVPREARLLDSSAATYSIVPAGHPMGYQDAFNAFVRDAYRSASGVAVEGLPSFADGYRATLITDAVLESSRSGNWIETTFSGMPEAQRAPA
jgi:predicted dehydrogenase